MILQCMHELPNNACIITLKLYALVAIRTIQYFFQNKHIERLNAANTNILHIWMPEPCRDMSFVNIASDMLEFLTLTRAINTYPSKYV